MAHFRGILRGAHGEASRLGTANSGMTVEAQSWEGKVVVTLYRMNTVGTSGRDFARITLEDHRGEGAVPPITLYDGPVSGARSEDILGGIGALSYGAVRQLVRQSEGSPA
jgi:hypothetical protein